MPAASTIGTASPRSTTMLRVASLALIAHAGLSLFSAFAFTTFLAPPPSAWLQTPRNQEVLAFMFTYGGQTTVVLGAIAGLGFLAHCVGVRHALVVFAISFSLSLTAELTGTSTGYPFGVYSYTDQLGYKIAGLVPFNIPTSWFYMLVASLAICGRLLPARDDNTSRWWWAMIAGLVLTAWDVSMDPAMVKTRHWLWNVPELTSHSPLARFIGTPFFFGMPLTNWLGWLLTGVLVARAMLSIVPPSVWTSRVSPYRFPLLLYAVNGFLPIGICLGQDMIVAGVLGTAAMVLPLALALRAAPRRVARPDRDTASGDVATAGRLR